MYALNLDDDNRVLSATYEKYAMDGNVIVETLPDDDITNYKYINEEYVYEPLTFSEESPKPTILERIEAQVIYTAMMTDTLLMEV